MKVLACIGVGYGDEGKGMRAVDDQLRRSRRSRGGPKGAQGRDRDENR